MEDSKLFEREFKKSPVAGVFAPGRVNLVGEHTDYNAGFVLPMAIDRGSMMLVRPRSDRRVILYTTMFDERSSFNIDELEKAAMGWVEYPKGMTWALREEGFDVKGWEAVVSCDIPVGAGLSSSASFLMAVARVFALTPVGSGGSQRRWPCWPKRRRMGGLG